MNRISSILNYICSFTLSFAMLYLEILVMESFTFNLKNATITLTMISNFTDKSILSSKKTLSQSSYLVHCNSYNFKGMQYLQSSFRKKTIV